MPLADEKTSTEPIKITRDMIDVAAEVLWRNDLLDITESWALSLSVEMLKRAAAAGHIEIDVEYP